MRKVILLSMGLILSMFTLIGCKQYAKDPNEYLEFLKRIDSSSSDLTITVENSKQTLEYKAKQIYSKEYGSVMTLEDKRKFILGEEGTCVVDSENNTTYTQEKDLDTIIKYSFIQEYLKMLYASEELNFIFEKNQSGNEYLLVDFIIPGTNRNFNNATLYINTANSLPHEIKVFDYEGNKTIDITYENFETNVPLEKDYFQIKQ